MPLTAIKYENTCIYKLCCNNPEIAEIYIGNTTDLVRRKSQHKERCNNENGKKYNFNVYQFIRKNGGWNNWNLILIEKFKCNNSFEACAKEREYVISLKSKLNSYIPNRTQQEYREDNKIELAEKAKEYYNNNKHTIIASYLENNKVVIAIKAKEYRDVNKIDIAEKTKEYREKNKKQITASKNEYSEKNKISIALRKQETRKEKTVCECGSICRISDIIRHNKSIKHQTFLRNQI